MKIANPYRLQGSIVCLLGCLLSGCGSDPDASPAASEVESVPQIPSGDPGGDTATTEPAAAAPEAKPIEPVLQMSDEAFLKAAGEGRIESIRRAIESGIDVNAADAESLTALHLASLNGHIQIVKLLLEHQATINAQAVNSLTALHMAAYNGHSDIVKLLLEHDVKVDPRDGEGKTPLLHACTGPFAETVAILIDAGADVNAAESTESFTPLMMAAGLGETDVVEILLRNKADKTIKDEDDEMAIDHARNSGHAQIIKLLE
jgi:ankyrin repeat protein